MPPMRAKSQPDMASPRVPPSPAVVCWLNGLATPSHATGVVLVAGVMLPADACMLLPSVADGVAVAGARLASAALCCPALVPACSDCLGAAVAGAALNGVAAANSAPRDACAPRWCAMSAWRLAAHAPAAWAWASAASGVGASCRPRMALLRCLALPGHSESGVCVPHV